MATYEVKHKATGKIFTIDGPDDATEDELQQQAEIYLDNMAKEAVAPRKSISQALKEGVDLGLAGVKQAYTEGDPEKIKEMKAAIKTDDPSLKFIQGAGEMLPGTLMGIAGTVPVSAGATKVVQAGIPLISKAVRMARPLMEGATGGGVAAGVLPSTEVGGQEEQAKEGAMLGAAVPAVLKPLSNIARFIQGLSTTSGQNRVAAESILKKLGEEEASRTIDVAKNAAPDPLIGTEHHVPALTRNLDLAAIEKASRNRFPAEYVQDEMANEARRREFVRQMTPTADDIENMINERTTNVMPLKHSLTGTPDLRGLRREFKQRAVNELAGGSKRAVIDDILRLLRGRDKLSPLNKVLETRDEITNTLERPGTTLRTASRESKVTMDQLNLIDDELNKATNNEYANYLRAFQDASRPIDEGRALIEISNDLAKAKNLTQANVAAAVRRHSTNDFGNVMTPATEEKLSALLRDLDTQEFPLRIKANGSDTMMNANLDALSAMEGPLLGFRNPLLGVLRGMQTYGKGGHYRALKDLVKDPQIYATEMQRVIDAIKRSNSPIVRSLMMGRTLPTVVQPIEMNQGE